MFVTNGVMLVTLIYTVLLYEQYVDWVKDKDLVLPYAVMLLEGIVIYLIFSASRYRRIPEIIFFSAILFRMSIPLIHYQIQYPLRRSTLSCIFAFSSMVTGVYLMARTCFRIVGW